MRCDLSESISGVGETVGCVTFTFEFAEGFGEGERVELFELFEFGELIFLF